MKNLGFGIWNFLTLCLLFALPTMTLSEINDVICFKILFFSGKEINLTMDTQI